MRRTFVTAAILLGSAALAEAQVGGQGTPWRGAGVQPCFGTVDNSANKCPAPSGMRAVRAGHLFDSKTGTLLANQVVVIEGDRILGVGPAGKVKIPAGAVVTDLSRQTVLPGLVDMHTHMFNAAKEGISPETETLLAVKNTQADLHAGFTTVRDMSTHGNFYRDVDIRNAINRGDIDGPRAQVSTRGIVWGAPGAKPLEPGESAVVHNVEEARAAVRDQIGHGADWIKLFPAGAYSFGADGTPAYVVTYPMPVLEALIDETHKLGHKTACHVYGGEGQKNAIMAGCDSIEHAFGLTQEQADMMVAKHLSYDPTLQRYTEPYMDDNDAKATGGKYRMVPIFEKAVTLASADQRLEDHGGQRRGWFDLPARYPGAGNCRACEAGASWRRRAPSSRRPSTAPRCWAGRTASDRWSRANMPTWSPCRAIRLPISPS